MCNWGTDPQRSIGIDIIGPSTGGAEIGLAELQFDGPRSPSRRRWACWLFADWHSWSILPVSDTGFEPMKLAADLFGRLVGDEVIGKIGL